ncbi:carbamoyltransferase [Halioglobus sp. Uisw_031]|jgi:carbamoyltransferase|uniref:carbamoyltransferase family protein n=1 Tax=Halioglobus sp. Uisw_031 TaxID=3230977 RepID=UPI0039ED36BF
MSKSQSILGISAYYHDSAAAVVCDGKIIAAAQEERFSRKKHDASFPAEAIKYCLEAAGVQLQDIDEVVFYDKPLVKFERLLETYLSYAPRGLRSFIAAMPVWLKEKLYLKSTLKRELSELAGLDAADLPELLFTEHHQSHAASAFYPSPFERAAVLCLDGVGEWATTTAWVGEGNSLKALWEIDFPHSLGLLYSAFTYYTGFKVNSGEYKLMGLAPYGNPQYVDVIKEHLLDLKEDGSFRLDMSYFNYCTGLTMTSAKFDDLFGGPPRKAESEVSQKEMDLAASIQKVTEEVVLLLGKSIREETGCEYLCLAGGVALNCVANGELLRSGIFKDIWIQPAAGDAGGALGAALTVWHDRHDGVRKVEPGDSMSGAYLGPQFNKEEIRQYLDSAGAVYEELDDDVLMPRVADILSKENVVGWFQGRMEFGPRALGARSIIGDPRSKKMQSVMNLKIKYRESFRPFAPSVLMEEVQNYFDHDRGSPYMLMVAPVSGQIRTPMTPDEDKLFGIDKLNVSRSELPSITHVDYSARIQTVHRCTNPRYHALISAFQAKTGCGVVVNTSFNVRGEPIVCTPEDSYRCFMRTEMDYLVIENFLLHKPDQAKVASDEGWMNEFELD